MKKSKIFPHFFVVFQVFVLMAVLSAFSCGGPQWTINNPYEAVDWNTHQQYKGNFHTHTTQSDGSGSPDYVIDCYKGLGYAILALTDHDTSGYNRNRECPDRSEATWPWQKWERDPASLGMVAVQGNEISRRHHIGSYFSDYGDSDVRTEEAAITEIGNRGGLAVMFHPGRYQRPLEWYVDLFRTYPHLVGLEIYNGGDRYQQDRETWDAILTEIIDQRPVWGYSNDDLHDPELHLGRNWNILVLPELSEQWVRRAMESGIFFYAYAPNGHAGRAPPEIQSVNVNHRRGIISIQASGYDRIEWISSGKTVHEGDTVQLGNVDKVEKYIRAVIHGEDGIVVGTQPFAINEKNM